MQNLHYPSFFLVPHLSLRLGQRFKICNFCFCSKYSEYVVHGLRSKKKKVYFFLCKESFTSFSAVSSSAHLTEKSPMNIIDVRAHFSAGL